MDPCTAVGLASAVVQFVQFASNLVQGTQEIYKSFEGASQWTLELDNIYGRLSGLSSHLAGRVELTKPHMDTTLMSSNDGSLSLANDLNRLASSCESACKELLLVTEKMRVTDGRNRWWKSFKMAIKEVLKQAELRKLQEHIHTLKSDMMFYVTVISNNNVLELQQQLGALLVQSRRMECSNTLELGKILNSTIDARTELKQLFVTYSKRAEVRRPTAYSHSTVKDGELDGLDGLGLDRSQENDNPYGNRQSEQRLRAIDVDVARMRSLTSSLSELSLKSRDISIGSEILRSLDFPQRVMRHNNITEAHARTFEWALRRDSATQDEIRLRKGKGSLRQWLESGENIFWVSGKPGSGKSTFMKFITSHPDTRSLLRSWASSKTLVVASHYFWSIGTPMQRSQQGLWQTLLFTILSKAPELISEVCQERWRQTQSYNQPQDPWSVRELQACFSQLGRLSLGETRICFFIDGLDEFEGDQLEIAESLIGLSKSANIKLCVSSRPWNAFEATLGRAADSKIYIHELTNADILGFTRSQLSRHPWWYKIADLKRAESLIEEISQNAQGVFLWVFLVTRLLRDGLTNGDNLDDLHKTLKTIPRDLEPFFKRMLESVSPPCYPKMAGFLEIAIESRNPCDAAIYFFHEMEYDDINFAFKEPTGSWSKDDEIEARDRVVQRLDAFCKGLLEVDRGGRVQFIHRTVADWLETTPIRSYLNSHVSKNFNARLAMIRAELARYKHPPLDTWVKFDGPRPLNWTGDGWDRLMLGLSQTLTYSELELDAKFLSTVFQIYDEYCRASIELFSSQAVILDPPWDDSDRRSENDFLVKFRVVLLNNCGHWSYLLHKLEEDPDFLLGVAEAPLSLRFPDRDTVPADMAPLGAQIAKSLFGLHLKGAMTEVLVNNRLTPSRCRLIRESDDMRFHLLDEGADGSHLITEVGDFSLSIPVWFTWTMLAFKLDYLEQQPRLLETLDRLLSGATTSDAQTRWINAALIEGLLCLQIRGLKGTPLTEIFRIHFLSNVIRKVLTFAVSEKLEIRWSMLRSALWEGFPQHLALAFDLVLPTEQEQRHDPFEEYEPIFAEYEVPFEEEPWSFSKEEQIAIVEDVHSSVGGPSDANIDAQLRVPQGLDSQSERRSCKRMLASGSDRRPSQRVRW